MATLTAPVQLTEAELKLLQTLVYQECGMFFDERRSHFLKDRLQRRLKACQLDSFYSYYRLLTSREGKAELALLLENLTVNETSFFRNRPQLDLLQKSVLEEILRKKQERRDWTLRVWSAGCSSGQEAYSLAISFVETAEQAGLSRKIQLFATDVNEALLEKGRRALYPKNLLQNVSPEQLRRFFVPEEGGYRIAKFVRETVVFARHNVLADPPFSRMDLITLFRGTL